MAKKKTQQLSNQWQQGQCTTIGSAIPIGRERERERARAQYTECDLCISSTAIADMIMIINHINRASVLL